MYHDVHIKPDVSLLGSIHCTDTIAMATRNKHHVLACMIVCTHTHMQGTIDDTSEMVQWNRVPDVSGTARMRIGSHQQVS